MEVHGSPGADIYASTGAKRMITMSVLKTEYDMLGKGGLEAVESSTVFNM
jgi:hypothetical protein